MTTITAENYTLNLGDCREFMRGMASGSVVTVTDPPYGVNLGEHDGAKETRPGLLVKAGGYDDSKRNFRRVVVPALRFAIRHLSMRAVVFCVPPSMWKLPAPNVIGGIYIPHSVGRNKWGWSTLIHALLYGVAPDLHKGAKQTALYSSEHAEKNGHPTPKPVGWMKHFIQLSSRPGDTIFDPFMGSGTTGVAALQLGRKFIGCELDPAYFAIAQRRIEQAAAQPMLLAPERVTAAQLEMGE